ncbi:tetratricopeptide repeat protein [Desulfosediminicola flagellatus]|uniref:tetratricopeptide repeat protein n=1 Tax=Desulfosediminicola flagellatus TaxID=2569541 RepID=UPI0010AD01DB|nr:tetratricopeptide repeat protein [Desulfosediminicola flagellatus]
MSISDREPEKNSVEYPSKSWELSAIIAACIILLTPFVYTWRINASSELLPTTDVEFTGSASCRECHRDAYQKWQGSDHDKAMAEANSETVLGDFSNVSFTDPYTDRISRFFMDNGKYQVETEGPDGKPGIFTITHTFGVYPLQQYLIPFPDGKLQCLSIAWDVEKKAWYRLPPYDVVSHTDWLHWTRGGQTWNGMCAECHSTRLQKNYDMESNSYSTIWFEIDVGCEACHGPGSEHLKWAELPALGRSQLDDFGLVIPTSNVSADQHIMTCAPCHSRRYQLGDNQHKNEGLLDVMVPSLLTEDLYYPDGQIKDEVYVYGSFVQSKMYRHDVRCNDCHDPHTLKLHKKDNALCLQCHRASEYDTPQHHFHKTEYKGKPSEGYLCVKCHMPGRMYMGIDYRPDHSLRIPRPDLSKKLGTPNGCSTSDCHGDKPLDWTIEHYTKWYGETTKPHYGEILAAGREVEENIDQQLIALVNDELLPGIVRATALNLLRNYPGEKTAHTVSNALMSDDPLIRQTAIRLLNQTDEETLLKHVAPKLYDPVKAVRIEAASRLAGIPKEKLRKEDLPTMAATLDEYRTSMEYNADFAPQRYNLGNLENALGNYQNAIEYYLEAINIDDQFIPAKVNLAMGYNNIGKKEQAEQLLREVVTSHPQMHEVTYSLGLLLSESERYEEAAELLGRASDAMPQYSRARYNYGLALLKLKRWEDGAGALHQAILLEPEREEYFITLVNLYLNFRMNDHARALVEEVLALAPDHANAKELLRVMKEHQ